MKNDRPALRITQLLLLSVGFLLFNIWPVLAQQPERQLRTVTRVIDGDTMKVRMDLGYDDSCRQVLRLRGIDCPEMDTREGQAAKAFVQSYIKEAQMIIVRSSRSDKYDRYLADIFVPREGEEEIFLNNLLLEKRYAMRWE